MSHLRALLAGGDETSSNESMVDALERSGALSTPECIAAFRKVDRGHFWANAGGGGGLAYADMPLRHGKLHQSAPHIYARALEAMLPLERGMSFLNVGSGTGYFSSIISEFIGDTGINDGIDIWPETLAHARERCKALGKPSIEFSAGNIYQLDVNACMRYDRVYLGACANTHARYLYELLEVGGILVGPFQAGHSQQLLCVTRMSEDQFKVEVLNAVHFAAFVEPTPEPNTSNEIPHPVSAPILEDSQIVDAKVSSSQSKDGIVGLPGVPFTFAVRQQVWTYSRNQSYPVRYRLIVALALCGRQSNLAALCLPAEIWEEHILPMCSRRWFEPTPLPIQRVALTPLGLAKDMFKRALLTSLRGAGSIVPADREPASPRSPRTRREARVANLVSLIMEMRGRDNDDRQGVSPQSDRSREVRTAGIAPWKRVLRRLGRCCSATSQGLRYTTCAAAKILKALGGAALHRTSGWRWSVQGESW